MHGMAQNKDTAKVTGIHIHDNSLDGVVGESFIDYPFDKATMDKAREPLVKNGGNPFDPISRITFFELAWFFDPFRYDKVPDYGPDAIEKMRRPVLGYGHYRVGPATLRYLFELAWS
jgi:hypothetical protein